MASVKHLVSGVSSAAWLVLACCANAAPALANSDVPYSVNDANELMQSARNGGKLYCGVPVDYRRPDFLSSDLKSSANFVVHLGTSEDGPVRIDIHKRVLERSFFGYDKSNEEDKRDEAVHLRFIGKLITSVDDTVVANFQSNSLLRHRAGLLPPGERASTFFGYKIPIRRIVQQNGGGGSDAVELDFRLIIDASYRAKYRRGMTSHRAALVVSRTLAPTRETTVREEFYRFLPNARPFWLLACVLDDGQET